MQSDVFEELIGPDLGSDNRTAEMADTWQKSRPADAAAQATARAAWAEASGRAGCGDSDAWRLVAAATSGRAGQIVGAVADEETCGLLAVCWALRTAAGAGGVSPTWSAGAHQLVEGAPDSAGDYVTKTMFAVGVPQPAKMKDAVAVRADRGWIAAVAAATADSLIDDLGLVLGSRRAAVELVAGT